MAEFNVDAFIVIMLRNLKKFNKDQLVELAQNLGVSVKKSQNKRVIDFKIFQFYVSEGIFETTESTKGSVSSTDHVMKHELEMKKLEIQLKERKLEIQMQRELETLHGFFV